MVDAARAMLDELMGRHRNLEPGAPVRKVNWDDPEFCQYYLVKFCPHDLFVNTRADLGSCPKLHDDEAKEMFESARYGARKKQFEDDFLRFCNNMLADVDREIQKGKQRLLLMNKPDGVGGPTVGPQHYVSKYQEQVNNLNARIKKLLSEAEEAGHRGDVDQAQGLMTLCEQLKDEKDALVAQHDNNAGSPSGSNKTGEPLSPPSPNETEKAAAGSKISAWISEMTSGVQEKQMEVCEICGAFLIVGDAQQRIEDHLMGKQHLGYSKLRAAVDELHGKRQKDRDEEEKRRQEERNHRSDNGADKFHRNYDNRRDYDHRRKEHSRDRFRREDDRYSHNSKPHYRSDRHRDHDHDRDRRERSRHENKSQNRSRSRSHRRSKSRSGSYSRK